MICKGITDFSDKIAMSYMLVRDKNLHLDAGVPVTNDPDLLFTNDADWPLVGWTKAVREAKFHSLRRPPPPLGLMLFAAPPPGSTNAPIGQARNTRAQIAARLWPAAMLPTPTQLSLMPKCKRPPKPEPRIFFLLLWAPWLSRPSPWLNWTACFVSLASVAATLQLKSHGTFGCTPEFYKF
jgi:hypothetical protein